MIPPYILRNRRVTCCLRFGDGFGRDTGRCPSPEGIIEATETTGPDRFLIGLQWHPEKLVAESELQK